MTDLPRDEPSPRDFNEDAFGIPARYFGYLTPELPAAIGRIVMLSALLESRISALASSVENKEQAFYASNDPIENLRVCERRLPMYDRGTEERSFAASTMMLVAESRAIVSARNAIVHRVWPRAGQSGWGGWKPLRKKERGGAAEWTEWTDYTSEGLGTLIHALIALIDRYSDAVAAAGSFPRRPDGNTPHAEN